MISFQKIGCQAFRDVFRPDELSWLDEKLMFVFFVGLFIFILPLSYYRFVFSFTGDDFYIQYIKNCMGFSCFATYAFLRLGMFFVRLLVGRVHAGPRI